MNSPDWLEITILLQGNFTAVLSFGGAAPETPRQGGAPKSRCRPPWTPHGSDYFMGGVAASFWTGVQCGGTIEDNQAPHPTISHLETDCSNSTAAPFAGQWLLFDLAVSHLHRHPWRPTETEHILSFSLVTTFVSISAGFWLVCIFSSFNSPLCSRL